MEERKKERRERKDYNKRKNINTKKKYIIVSTETEKQ